MRNTVRAALLSGAVVGAIVLPGASATAATANFSNSEAIAVPTAIGAATPYPSNISVSGTCGTVTDANVTLHDINVPFDTDLDVLLVGPTGAKMILMSDAGGDDPLGDVTLTFDDAAAASLPEFPTGFGSGTYKPTNHQVGAAGPDTFSAPAPVGPYPVSLAEFNGTDPNGTWQLFVMDDYTEGEPAGSITGGWTLNLTTSTDCPPPPTATCEEVTVNKIDGTEGDDNLVGTINPDAIFGLDGNDELDGVDGDDCLDAGEGDDRASGGADNDVVKGGDGRDRVRGLGGKDRLKGQGGEDRVNGGEGRDKLSGGRGADKLRGGAAKDTYKGNAGDDKLNAVDAKRDRVNCGAGDDKAVVDPVDRVSRNCETVREVEKD